MIHLYLPTSLSLIPPGTEYRVLGTHQVWGNLPLIQTRTECPSLPVAPPECDSAREGLDSCIVEWVIADAPVLPPPSLAAKAVVLHNALSPQLPPQYQDELADITNAITAATGTTTGLGEAATHEAEQLITDLKAQGLDALADRVTGALQAVQAVWTEGGEG